MPIFKAIDKPGKSIKTIINYAAKDSKKEKDETLFSGINCADNPAFAAYQMQKTKELYGKPDGRQYKHYVLSFAEGEISKENAKTYAKELAEKCFGDKFEVAVGIHINSAGAKIHAHIVVNSVFSASCTVKDPILPHDPPNLDQCAGKIGQVVQHHIRNDNIHTAIRQRDVLRSPRISRRSSRLRCST